MHGVVGDLTRAEQEGLLVAEHLDRDHHAGLDNTIVGGGLADGRVIQQVRQLADARLHLALLGSREITDDSMHVFSEASPIGAAVNGHEVGDVVTYVAPNGKTIEVKILHTKPYDG